ncbi:hypothetical protein [Natronobacterium gregoryi]|uniref:Uncharacterized protein n=2 Tax=Natronobacterium gregoryi TaxID=44930 RepID=L0AH27_NATGS|nr:hypothetical protein [Natronobacterium gregoryi]AFZ72729.1 hypothetical protein Natgr_1523 [Natronobacterium gregoryi SP2]ELY69216.1 hypothetical protein C490_08274 [Natronobacterium gregoryi SP2]PLK18451.1 hypothetical protein CYV19_17930 [Natronobacterium gregoryi SP2]SFJ70911.1 hypothetical protein SAMN05443661_16212 [Natronobacterium gregoryi]
MESERPNESSVLERLRQPEYTGENRCIPCTAVNVVIAVVLAIAVAVVSLPAAPIVFGLSLAAIYVRGYLVPGTPTLTKRYFPDWLLAKFDKAPATRGTALENDADAAVPDEPGSDDDLIPDRVDPERQFLEHGVVAPCEEVAGADGPDDDLCLTAAVRQDWQAELEAIRDGDRRRQVATFLEIDPAALDFECSGEQAIARVDGRQAAFWESEAALLADLAAAEVLANRLPNWDRLSLENRSQLASGLRTFVESCPGCGGSISLDEETVESCCRSHQVYAITCEACEARLLEVST